jgi:hypothetical protein
VWLAGSKEATGQSSIAHETLVALREIGLLADILVTNEGLVVYPSEMDAER